jgi:hypothetical protein
MGSYYSTPQTVTFDLSDPASKAKCPLCNVEISLKNAYEHSIVHSKPSGIRILKDAGEYDVNI